MTDHPSPVGPASAPDPSATIASPNIASPNIASPKIFVTVGTDHHPFDRLVQWGDSAADAYPAGSTFIQRGTTDVVPQASAEPFIDAQMLHHHLDTADIVICHGGPSTIMEAKAHGHFPIVVPRNPEFGEHVDGHQMRFCDHLARRDAIHLATSVDDVLRFAALVLDSGGRGNAASTDARDATLTEISALVHDLCATPRRRLAWLQARSRPQQTSR